MLQIIEPLVSKVDHLDSYALDPRFAPLVHDLRVEAARIAPRLRGRVWMVNSTAQGGGVAEMLPGVVSLLRELGLDVHWAVIDSDRPEFFTLTKRLHNLIHGEVSAGVDLGADDARLLETVGRENAEQLAPSLGSDDVVLVHDPQPIALGSHLARTRGVPALWRCHIGLDEHNAATCAAWRFLQPFLEPYAHAVFSAPEYIPGYLTGRASLLHPGLDPHSHKNRPLSVVKLTGILCNSGLVPAYDPVPTPDYADPVRRVGPGGALEPPGEIGLLFRPIVLQVSRWDRLKGWTGLLDGFLELKRRVRAGRYAALDERNRRRLELARLVLAGPDPTGVADDPEGLAVFDEIRAAVTALEPELRSDVVQLVLPMTSRKVNALIVNGLQRCASLVCQNSRREGFGLTVTEAMYKRQAVLGTHAVGIRQQIRDRVDGWLLRNPDDAAEIADAMATLLVDARTRWEMGRTAHRRVHDNYLIFTQLSRYLTVLADHAGRPAS